MKTLPTSTHNVGIKIILLLLYIRKFLLLLYIGKFLLLSNYFND